MGIALTPSEVVERLIQDRKLTSPTEPHTAPFKANRQFRLTVDDLNIIRKVGESTLDGWDLEPEADDD